MNPFLLKLVDLNITKPQLTMTFSALTSGPFDSATGPQSGEFNQTF